MTGWRPAGVAWPKKGAKAMNGFEDADETGALAE